jgi:hypothetical protein
MKAIVNSIEIIDAALGAIVGAAKSLLAKATKKKKPVAWNWGMYEDRVATDNHSLKHIEMVSRQFAPVAPRPRGEKLVSEDWEDYIPSGEI